MRNTTKTAGTTVLVPYTPPRLGRRHSRNDLLVRTGLHHLLVVPAKVGYPRAGSLPQEFEGHEKGLRNERLRDSALAAMCKLPEPPKAIYVAPEYPKEKAPVEGPHKPVKAVKPVSGKVKKAQVPEPKQVVAVDKSLQKEPKMRKAKGI